LSPSNVSSLAKTDVSAFTKSIFQLFKFRVIELLLITSLPAMFLAARGMPSVNAIIGTLFGGSLAAASDNAWNSYLDRDIDSIMDRTSQRPLPLGKLSPLTAQITATLVGALSLIVMMAFTNLLATFLTLVAILWYVVLYTFILKRKSSQNIIWGGIAGCMPVLIGWAAVTNSLSWQAWLLFVVVFFWTPAHFWALAIKYKEDYAAASIPMLPVVKSRKYVSVQIIIYAVLTVLSSLLLTYDSEMGIWYLAIALITGFIFISQTISYHFHKIAETEKQKAMNVFHGSITYLTILSLAIVVLTIIR
jgi:heme o synthase